ncbi:D-erythro-7,8-dihydroneopterin triphosphate 2'-epimerase,dihydroneopterin aldolase,Dihydroneopterin aldolase [Chlamydia serpentis]|uniref:7,8-dihydroneopterin aldolase n=1 Tax=Chlamydia serpentis TaxID=1967782 RepID=A0A2R8FC26_9CHLA|nr:dihydroneopterin aldolase [Chlamydia serpentis]SPN73872.1 D-erythro-7,8-dihydroneopterin triphosphate 2'-epimerase,dihydroneopterin aldolase,Dihydroneopterin aldolase [Chlamydia serpentis]
MVAIERYQLVISNFRVWLFLGCSLEERHFKQPVLISVTLSCGLMPPACVSDQLADACCYVELTSLLEEVATAKAYTLIEHLAKELLDSLVISFGDKISKIDLEVAKERPPVPNLLNPIKFKISKEICPSTLLSV